MHIVGKYVLDFVYKSACANMACDKPFILVKSFPVPHLLPVPCGKCQACRIDKISMWTDRIQFEAMTSPDASGFLTLTFDDAHMPENRSANKKVMSDFFKRLRYYSDKKFKFFYSSEYGETTYRLHYHVCMLNFDANDVKNIEDLAKAWADRNGNRLGIFTFTPLLPARIRYCVEYISFENPKLNAVYKSLGLSPCVHSCSKQIGEDWIMSHADVIRETNGYFSNGVLKPLPPYYVNKLGLHDKYEYLDNLSGIWSKYNERLKARGVSPIDPFNLRDVSERGLLDVPDYDHRKDNSRRLLNDYINLDCRERSLAHKAILKIEKSQPHLYALDLYNLKNQV